MKPRRDRRLRHRVYRGPSGFAPATGAGELIVEYFTDRQLIAWRARAGDIQDYHYLWFFELERQRTANHAKLREALGTVTGTTIELAGWGRALAYKYSNTPLSCVGSLKWVGGRFNYGVDIDSSRYTPFPALYLAQDLETGLREMHGLLRDNDRAGMTANELAFCSESGITWAAVEGSVHNIFDITRIANLEAFAEVLATFKFSRNVRAREEKLRATSLRLISTADELHQSFMTENWREFPSMLSTPANSQLFGHLLSQAGFEGALFSSTITQKLNLALFPRQFENSASIVKVIAPPPGANCCELSAATYADAERVKWD